MIKAKSDLRNFARARRAALAAACPDFATRIAGFAPDLDLKPKAVAAGYWPMGDEADPRALMAALAARGHALALPRIEAKSGPLVFHRWRESDALTIHVLGMSEPCAASEVLVPDVLLVPVLAFDSSGHRLGYGGGYYDRTLDALRANVNVRAIGIAYAGQKMETLPREAHDHALDMIVTEREILRIG
jgi:5-formyltetrahydrofolate cyclo-ligase